MIRRRPKIETIWASAFRAAGGVARKAASSEQDVIRAVSEELHRMRLRGSVALLTSDGLLQMQSPSLSKSVLRTLKRLSGLEIHGYTFDPKNPAPSEMDGHMNAVDNRLIEIRKDVLVYTTEELQEPITILGRVFVYLHAASDALDTDFTARILDVYPDGRSVNLGPQALGIRRARYRNGYEKEELLTPNKPEKFKIELFDIGHTFLPGHKIRIDISSSAYPQYNPNQNTGNPVATDTEWKIAQQTIYHDGQRPSHVLLPILPEKESLFGPVSSGQH